MTILPLYPCLCGWNAAIDAVLLNHDQSTFNCQGLGKREKAVKCI